MTKKVLIILAAAAAAGLMLCSCSSSQSSETGSSPQEVSAASQTEAGAAEDETTTLSSQKAEGVARDIEKGNFDNFKNYSDQEKELIRQTVEKDGYTLEYNDDGSATLSNDEVSVIIGAGWVENEYTKDIPAPGFGTVTKSSEGSDSGNDFYIFLIKDADAQQIADYISKLEQTGFAAVGEKTVDIENGVISFDGQNSEGKKISIGFTQRNGMTLKITK